MRRAPRSSAVIARAWCACLAVFVTTTVTAGDQPAPAPEPDAPSAGSAAAGPEAHPRPNPPRGRQRVEAYWSHRTLGSRLAVHDPIYFIAGLDAPEAKFQLSFKYRLATFQGEPQDGPSHTLQFAYSQRSLWNIGSESSPFYDTSYMPELMYQLAAAPEGTSGLSWLGLQTGFAHESNGRAEPTSRSMNKYFIRSAFSIGPPDGWYAVVTPTVYTYIGDLDDNPDLERYRDFFDLRVVLARADKESLMFTWVPGRGLSRGSRQLDLSVPLRISAINFATFVQLQYFDGYGESLLSYDERTSALRLGIALVR